MGNKSSNNKRMQKKTATLFLIYEFLRSKNLKTDDQHLFEIACQVWLFPKNERTIFSHKTWIQ